MAVPHFTIKDGVYTRAVSKKAALVFIIIALLLGIAALAVLVGDVSNYIYAIGIILFALVILAAATTKLIINTASKTVIESYLFGLIKKKKNGKLFNQYEISDLVLNGTNVGKQIFLVNTENRAIRLPLFGPFKNAEQFQAFENITKEIVSKLQT
jgi:hypothetical protein